MQDLAEFDRHRAEISAALQAKFHVRPAPFAKLVSKSVKRLPRKLRKQARLLVEADVISTNPKLRMTLDQKGLSRAGRQILAYLETVDLAQDRRDRWLSGLGGAAFSLIAVVVLLLVVLRWRGFL